MTESSGDAASGFSAEDQPNEHLDCLLFRVRSRRFAVPLDSLKGVDRASAITPLPGAPSWLLGMMFVRGTIEAVVDIGGYLGEPPIAIAPSTRVILLIGEGMKAALAVDALLRIESFDKAGLTPSIGGAKGLTTHRIQAESGEAELLSTALLFKSMLNTQGLGSL